VLELVAYINTSGRPSRRERNERRDSDIDVHRAGVRTIPYGIHMRLYAYSFGCFTIYIYIYLIYVNLDYYQNNSSLSVDVGKLSNHVKSMSFSLLIFFFLILYTVHHYCARLQHIVRHANLI
jgi:hypothetical protein